MAACFELSNNSEGQFMFILKAVNGEVILSSELYRARSLAEKDIVAVQNNCALDESYERTVSANGNPMFNLKTDNQHLLGTSQLYATTAARDAAIASVKANGVATSIKYIVKYDA
jgi:uncharacterized protein YegP (UPF0339 family)